MAELNINEIISLTKLVESFNDNVWVKLAASIGTLHTNDNKKVTLSQDAAPRTGGTISIKTGGVPQMNATAYIGVNTNNKSEQITVKNALPPAHLQTIDKNGDGVADIRRNFTLKWEDIASKKTGEIINANAVYNACYAVLRQLISIRPLKTTWNHEGSAGFTTSYDYYAIYKDSNSPDLAEITVGGKQVPAIDSARHTVGSGTSMYYEWSGYSKGANFSIYSAIANPEKGAQVVQRNNCTEGQKLLAAAINREIQIFWEAWQNKCLNKNRFTYTYHTCHLSCHSSCYCHNSRHRR